MNTQVNPEVKKLTALGDEYAKKNDHNLAVSYYFKAISLAPQNDIILYNCGKSLMELKKYDHAIALINDAIKINPGNTHYFSSLARSYFELAESYSHMKNYNLAIINYNKAIEFDSNNSTYYNNRGVCYSNKGNYHRAIKSYDEALRLNPNSTTAYKNRNIATNNCIINRKNRIIRIRNKLIKTAKYRVPAIAITVIIFVLLFSKSFYNKGYVKGEKKGIINGYSDVKKEYTPSIDRLNSELNKIVKDNENKIAVIKRNHNAKINSINRNHDDSITQMVNSYNSNINQINNTHYMTITSMERMQRLNLENTKKENYDSGQKNMEGRIKEIYNLDIQNREVKDDWNTTVNINKK